MNLILEIFFLAIFLVGLAIMGILIGFGFTLFRAKVHLECAVNIANSGNPERALGELLKAFNAMPTLKNIIDIQELSHALNHRDAVQIAKAIDQVRNSQEHWPKTRMEVMVSDYRFWILITVFLCYIIVYICIKS